MATPEIVLVTPDNAPTLDEWATSTEVADYLGISRQAVNVMIRSGQFDTLHIIGNSPRPTYVIKRTEMLKVRENRDREAAIHDKARAVKGKSDTE